MTILPSPRGRTTSFLAVSKRNSEKPKKNSERRLRACKGEGITQDAANKQNQRSRSNRIHFTLAARDSNSDFAVNLSPARLHVTIETKSTESKSMLWTIFVILLVLWLL